MILKLIRYVRRHLLLIPFLALVIQIHVHHHHVDNEQNETSKETSKHPKNKVPLFKIIGDNLDKTVRPRHETIDHCMLSLYYFHLFSVKDHCDTSKLTDSLSLPDIDSFSPDALLPSDNDYSTTQQPFSHFCSNYSKTYTVL